MDEKELKQQLKAAKKDGLSSLKKLVKDAVTNVDDDDRLIDDMDTILDKGKEILRIKREIRKNKPKGLPIKGILSIGKKDD